MGRFVNGSHGIYTTLLQELCCFCIKSSGSLEGFIVKGQLHQYLSHRGCQNRTRKKGLMSSVIRGHGCVGYASFSLHKRQ
jgi:hypothetical protein